jgi:hypothetical protein
MENNGSIPKNNPLKTPAHYDISRRKWLTAAAGMLPVAALTGELT